LPAALTWIEAAANAGDADAQAWMGDCRRLGLVQEPDLEAAEQWYRKAASQGHVGSIALLASAVDSMDSLSADAQTEILGMWLVAASAGDTVAQIRVGECYLEGRGCAANAETAAHWFQVAADRGDAEGQYRVGLGYLLGRGVDPDWHEALEWFELAARQGHVEAREALNEHGEPSVNAR
jgi:TPR repeat protein